MNNSMDLYYSNQPLCEEGRQFLTDRFLSIPDAIKCGVRSRDKQIYFFFTLNGEPVRWKSRSMERKSEQKFSYLPPELKDKFKTPFFSQFKDPRSEDLFITEGEFDCVALKQLGAINVVSLPSGASSVESSFKHNYEFLQKFERIFICFDMDGPGDEAAKKAMSLIKPSKFRRIYFPCKDANDWIKSDPTLENKDLLVLMENAKKVDHPAFTHSHELPENYYEHVDLGVSTGFNNLDKILGGLRTSEVTVIAADTGAGKTTFSINLFMNLAESGHGVSINSYEMNPKTVNRKMAGIALKKSMKYKDFTEQDISDYKKWMKNKNCYLNTSNQRVDLEVLKNMFEIASLAYGIKYVLIDHLDYIYCNGKKKTALENIDDAIREIHVLAMEYKIGVVLIVHPKQMPKGSEISMNDLKGSAAIKQYADNIIILTRMDRVQSSSTNVRVSVCKNRLCGKEKSFFMKYIPENDSYEEIQMVEDKILRFD